MITLASGLSYLDVNFCGVMNGCQTALPHLKAGGALITVGSEVSDSYAPTPGKYTSAKHAVKGYVDCLRDPRVVAPVEGVASNEAVDRDAALSLMRRRRKDEIPCWSKSTSPHCRSGSSVPLAHNLL